MATLFKLERLDRKASGFKKQSFLLARSMARSVLLKQHFRHNQLTLYHQLSSHYEVLLYEQLTMHHQLYKTSSADNTSSADIASQAVNKIIS